MMTRAEGKSAVLKNLQRYGPKEPQLVPLIEIRQYRM